jgi:lysophospholipase L1-like esterase
MKLDIFAPPRRRSFLAGLALALAASGLWLAGPPSALGQSADERWVGTWSTGMVAPAASAPGFADQTLRQIVHIGLGGERLRVRLSNAFGTAPLTIDGASLAVQAGGAAVVPGTLRALSFGGEAAVTIQAGARVLSDPVALSVDDEENLAVSLYLASDSGPPTLHSLAHQTSYISEPGDFTGDPDMPVAETTTSWFFLGGIEVVAQRQSRTVVALGDSITEGFASSVDGNARYPDALARRLLERFGRFGGEAKVTVVNAGISGNRVLTDVFGPNAQARLDRDVLTQSGVSHVILLEGINDIGIPDLPPVFGLPPEVLRVVSAEEIIAGMKQIVARARARGLKIYGGTILPFETAIYFTEAGEAKRQAVNQWIRTSGGFDAVIDFDAAIRDPADPRRMLPAFDSGDNLHPNDAGYQAMADAVDLSLFDPGN